MKSTDNTTPHHSAEYDVEVKKTIPFYENFHLETIEWVKTINPDVKIWLDTGCGTGYTVEKASPAFPQTKFILCDPSEKMLNEAKQRIQGKVNNPVDFINVSSQDLNQKIHSPVDVVTSIQSHHYLTREERVKAVRSCYEVMDTGGIYVTFENIYPGFEKGVEIGLKRWMDFQINEGREKKTVEQHAKRFNQEYFPITVKEHLKLLKETGFRIYDLLWYSHMQAGFYAIK